MDLFHESRRRNREGALPLAVRMRPASFDEFVGQSHFLAPGKLLRRMLEADRLVSIILYGPPGTGKTTLAELIARQSSAHFEQANAASIGVKEVRTILDAARDRLETSGKRTLLFLDEIHRFSRNQQDVLLNDVENGGVILVGATTENPFFSVNSALVSRSQIFQFQPISEPDILALLRRAIGDETRGYGRLKLRVSEEALRFWATACDGDARRALTALEIAVLSTGCASGSDGGVAAAIDIDLKVAQESMQRKAIVYDGSGDEHYDASSALIKSMRGSDPDAAVYWLARMLEAGEDPRFVARRVAILASEDIGNADPNALNVAASCMTIVERIGMPEAQLTLGQAVIYMALAPKSNASARAIWDAMSDVREGRTLPVPMNLRDPNSGAARLRASEGDSGGRYINPHLDPHAALAQSYLGVEKTYYRPTDAGLEQELNNRRVRVKRSRDGQTAE